MMNKNVCLYGRRFFTILHNIQKEVTAMEVMIENMLGIHIYLRSIVCCIPEGPLNRNRLEYFKKHTVYEQVNYDKLLSGWKTIRSPTSLW